MGSSHNKGKAFEQKTGKLMLEVDGPCPKWENLTTETGRTGQLSELQMDTLSRSYAGECKVKGAIPKKPFQWFNKIKEIAKEHNKEAFLAMKVDGRKFKYNIIHCITDKRHAELLKKEKKLEEIENVQT